MQNHVHYPELGERPDLGKLFQRASHIGRFTFVSWEQDRDQEARQVLRGLGVRPKIEPVECTDGRTKYKARLTGEAWDRVRATGNVCIEALL